MTEFYVELEGDSIFFGLNFVYVTKIPTHNR